MTLKTWKKEFYPVPASKSMSKIKAIEHSLKKWRGLTKSNLKKHDLEYFTGFFSSYIVDDSDELMNIDDSSCALCKKFLPEEEYMCEKCPLFIHLGKRCDFEDHSPFVIFLKTKNPVPMIKALEETLKENL